MVAENRPESQGRIRGIRDLIPQYSILAALAIPSYFFLYHTLPAEYEMYRPLIGAIFYAVGSEIDNESTIAAVSAIQKWESLTKERSPAIESNLLLPERPTWEDMYNFKRRVQEAAFFIPSTLIPSIGIALGLQRLFFCGLKNLGIKAFYERRLGEFLSTPKVP